MKDIKDLVHEIFEDDEDIPPIDPKRIEELRKKAAEYNKPNQRFWINFRRISTLVSCLLVIVVSAILIPILTNKKVKYHLI